MDFQRVGKPAINNLIEKYNKIKRRTGWDLATRERNVKHLLKEQEKLNTWLSKLILVQYLEQEIIPLLEHFEGEDKEVVRQYFRFISKAKITYPGFSIPRSLIRPR